MPTSRSKQLRTPLKWAATLGLVGFALLLPSNLLWRYRLNFTYNASIRVFDGCIALQFGDGSRPMPLGFYYRREARPHIKWDLRFYPPGMGAWGVQAPVVIPLGLFGLAAASLWWLDWRERRRALVGHCARCGYDLRGLASPGCPECGRNVGLPSIPQPQRAT